MNKDWCYFGEEYYNTMNTEILQRKKEVYLEGIGSSINPFASNHKIPSGFLKKIIDQKVSYVLGNGIIFNQKFKKDKDVLDRYVKETFDEFVMEVGTEASKKGEAWILAYKEKNQTKFKLIQTQELNPKFDEYGDLVEMVRSYGDEEYFYKDVYNSDSIVRLKRKASDKEYKQYDEIGHYTQMKMIGGVIEGVIEHSFGRVPFIRLKNNPEELSDLFPIKALIDVYDIIYSDFANNIDDMQDAFLTLKGYSGDSKNIQEFMKQLKQLKAIPVGEDGDVGVNQLQIPVEARDVFLKLLRQEIYDTAMAVDVKNIGGGSLTNVHIKAMFADLDMKANKFESEVRKFIYRVIDFIDSTDGVKIAKEITFNRSIIMNRNEYIESVVKLMGILSQRTILELLPFDIDVDEEFKRLAEERGEVLIDEPDETR